MTAGCGMSWRAPVENKQELIEAAEQAGIATDGAYEIVI
ncbi:MAG: putative Se/S carrier-like protein [Christensenellales bacterium]